MARIKIEDLPVKEEMSEQELKGVFGGAGNTRAFNPQPEPPKGFGFHRVRRGLGRRGNIRGLPSAVTGW